MDIKDRVMGDKPNSWLHKIAGIIPGFKGYTDRERRRDADKLLRTHLAKQYSAQRDRLNRVQQSLLRAKRMDQIAEVDRLTGVFQRFIDRLNTATYGYTGMFDPVKIEAEDLDQLYAFDMTLANGVDQASTAIGAIEESISDKESNALPSALDRFSQLVDDLNEKLNQRSELLTSGTRVPDDQFQSMLGNLNPIPPYGQREAPEQGASTPEVSIGKSESTSTSGNTNSGGEVARYAGGDALNTEGGAGVPTTSLGVAPYDQQTGSGTESASSPAAAPGAPGHDIVQGLDMASALDNVSKTSSGVDSNRAPDSSR